MNVTIITIGDEILIGQIIDSNSAWMATQLNLQGLKVKRILSISDDLGEIVKNIGLALEESDVLLLTGGLGPTKDDITKQAIAEFLGVDMYFDEPTYAWIKYIFEKFGRTVRESHKEQCYMPNGVNILANKKGTAPGMWFELGEKVMVSMPGVPWEMKYLMEFEVLPKLGAQFPGIPIIHQTILTVGEGESTIAERISPVVDQFPENIKVAYLPNLGRVRIRLSATGDDKKNLQHLVEDKVKSIVDVIPELVFGFDKDILEQKIGEQLIKAGKTLGTAESCTGGYIGHLITKVSGSSAYYKGSIIAYANEIKQNQLNVNTVTLEKHGAVSEETVKEMVNGALNALKVDIAVATSGIAGPTGGTDKKPVGTIWLAIGDKDRVKTEKLQLGKDRIKNIEYTAVTALNMIRKFLLEQ